MTCADVLSEHLDVLCGLAKGLMNFIGIGPEPPKKNKMEYKVYYPAYGKQKMNDDFTLCRERPQPEQQDCGESADQKKMRIVRAAKKQREAKQYAKIMSEAINKFKATKQWLQRRKEIEK